MDFASDMASDSRVLCRRFKVKPNLGEHSGRAVSCKQCKRPEEMVTVKNKRCLCGKAAQCYYGEAGGKAVCCKHCKTPEMVDVKHKRCRCGMRQPSFGEAGCKAVCCKQCKAPEMVFLKSKRYRQNNREKRDFDCRQDTI